jgi:dTDP-4-dehydrorhamnose reductase
MIKRTLLFGASGYIGSEFHKQIGDVVVAPGHRKLNSYKDVHDVIKTAAPTCVINAAGYTGKPNVDACESQKDQCLQGNIILPLWIAQACDTLKVPFAHVSSGCIYNGHERVYTEQDVPDFSFAQNNCSFYSGTKAQAEALLQQYNCYIWRLRIPFNSDNSPRNFLTKMLNYTSILNLPNSVSHREEFVTACLKTLELQIPAGVYNVTNPGSTDARTVLELFKQHHPSLTSLIDSKKYFASVEEFMTIAKAARSNCVLDASKLASFGVIMRPVDQAIEDAVIKYQV